MFAPLTIEVSEVDKFTKNVAKTLFKILILEDKSFENDKSNEKVKNDDSD